MILRLLALFIATVLAVPSALAVDKRTANNGQLVMEDVPPIPDQLRADLVRYENTRSAAAADWSADGTSLYITTRFGDVNQLHRVDQPGGARHQLTFFREPITGATRRPDHDTLLYLKDAGGNEFSQIFSFDPATGDSTLLTDGESRNSVVVWNRDGSAFAYQSTRRNGRSNDLWLMPAGKPEAARLILEAPAGKWWGPTDFSSDGRRLLVQEYTSSTDSRLHLLDLVSGQLTDLHPQGGEARRYGIGFAADDKEVFYLTDAGGEFTRLIRRNLSTGEETAVGADLGWDIENVVFSRDRKQAAVLVNAGGVSELYLLDPRKLRLKRAKNIPAGIITSVGYSPDGKQLALSLNGSTSAGDTYVYEPRKGRLTRWTYSEVGGLDTSKFVEPETITYSSFDGLEIPAFVYKPRTQGPHPVIISIHGGPEAQARPYFSSTYQLWLAKLGAAVIVPNVRGSAGYGKQYVAMDNGFKRYDSVKDIGALLDWVARQPDLDADRVAVFGGSYGGFMVLASAVEYSDRLAAAVDIVGISNFVTFLENTQDYRRDLRRVEYGDERDPAMREFLESISPNNNVEKIRIPMFVVQGQNDPRVPVTEAEQIVAALRENGNTVWYMNALNEGHGYRKKENQDEYRLATMLFFQAFLLGEK